MSLKGKIIWLKATKKQENFYFVSNVFLWSCFALRILNRDKKIKYFCCYPLGNTLHWCNFFYIFGQQFERTVVLEANRITFRKTIERKAESRNATIERLSKQFHIPRRWKAIKYAYEGELTHPQSNGSWATSKIHSTNSSTATHQFEVEIYSRDYAEYVTFDAWPIIQCILQSDYILW